MLKNIATKSLLNIVEATSATKELEAVPEDDSVKLPPTSTTSRPPIIVEEVSLVKSSPVMVETILSEDDVSEVSLICNALIS